LAKKHRPQIPREPAPAARGPAGQIEEALRRLRRGELEAALRLATGVLGAAAARKDSANTMLAGVAHETQAEVYFRPAVREADAS
jgi:hypothetical protein